MVMRQGYRAQMDRKLYKKHMKAALTNYRNLEIRTANVKDIVLSPFDPEQPSLKRQVVGLRVSTSKVPS